jgi:hypothetical protein
MAMAELVLSCEGCARTASSAEALLWQRRGNDAGAEMGVFKTRLTACPIRQSGSTGQQLPRLMIFRELFGFSNLQLH